MRRGQTEGGSLRWLPVATGLVVFAATASIALTRNDFTVFLFALFVYAPVLAIAVVILIVLGCGQERRERGVSFLSAALAIVVIAPATFALFDAGRDQILFTVWSPFHHARIASFEARDGIVEHWDGWGIAGMENDSYLVVDRGPTLTSADAATAWIKRRGGRCDIVGVERLRTTVYILITYNCSL